MSLERIARRDVEIVGVAITPLRKPLDPTLGSLTSEAVDAPLSDAALSSRDIQRVVFSNAAAVLSESGTGLSLTPEPSTSGSVMMRAYPREARSYARRHGVDMEKAHTALRVKNRAFAATNHHVRELISVADVRSSRPVADPLRLMACSPLTDGAAAVVFRAADGFDASNARPRVAVVASEMFSHEPGESAVARAATKVFQQTATAAADMDVFQLHDACAFAELQQYEQVGIAERGSAADAVLSGLPAAGGDAPVSTDGGLLTAATRWERRDLPSSSSRRCSYRGARRAARSPTPNMPAVNADGWMVDDTRQRW